MSQHTLYDHVWDRHEVAKLSDGVSQLFIGMHFIHEVTTPQAFADLKERGLPVAFPDRTMATMDHIIPTDQTQRPYADSEAELMAATLLSNVKEFGIKCFDAASQKQGIVHVIGPELGLTQPGMTIACGDSHTSTHGAFGSLAFGIGTTQVRNVLATQTLSVNRLKVRRIWVKGTMKPGLSAKDIVLKIIADLGVKGGIGYAYEYAGPVIDAMSMDGRMTICNMSIEGGARVGYVNPDQTTYEYMKDRPYAPSGEDFDRAIEYWESIRSKEDAIYDDEYVLDVDELAPVLTWGVTPGQGIEVTANLPDPAVMPDSERAIAETAYRHMKLAPGAPIAGTPVQVAFIGSCTNSRLSDLREAADVFKGRKVSGSVRTLVVPGSMQVKAAAEAEGLDQIFKAAGAEWREPGCSMCLAMNPDRLEGDEICASSSNRNFIGRQGSPTGRTLLMSPAMVAAAAISGKVVDVRDFLGANQ